MRPLLEYACSVWDPYTEENISRLEAVQRRAARFVSVVNRLGVKGLPCSSLVTADDVVRMVAVRCCCLFGVGKVSGREEYL